MDRAVFVAFLAVSLSGWASPPQALLLGLVFGLGWRHPFAGRAKDASKLLLQASVVGLGFGMDLRRVLEAGLGGLAYTAAGIALTMAAGRALGRRLAVRSTTSTLISVGTAICGGSAIAAVAPVLDADAEETSVALGTVFLLNGAGLLLFPPIGAALGLTQEQFGLWAALAIHDTSSVVGASLRYGAAALAVGTTVKLARALWIAPLTLALAALRRSKAAVPWPWFIAGFIGASFLRTSLPAGAGVFSALYALATLGLTATLFLIGSGISKATLRKVGARPLIQGVLLWALVASVSLAAIVGGVIP
ncbi:MAG: putative sulfate exporter family transporter [Elusimicrobia bacterium]|nr:putative sulfate exporter family transporter [Elusimicrobiota bacterium]